MSYRVRGMSRPFCTQRKLVARKDPSAGASAATSPAGAAALGGRVVRGHAHPHVVLLTPPGVDVAPLRSGLAQAYREIRRDLPAATCRAACW